MNERCRPPDALEYRVVLTRRWGEVKRVSDRLRKVVCGASASALLFSLLFLIYALTIHGQLRYGDETERYLQAQSLIDRRTFEIPFVPGHQTLGPDGKNYDQFEMGYGILLIPPYAVGRIVDNLFKYPDPDWIPLLFVFLVNPAITAFTGVILFWFNRNLTGNDRVALWTALLFGLATMAWPYTMGLYREPLQGMTLLAAVYALYLFRQRRHRRWLWISGISLGYCIFTKIANLFMLPLFCLFLLWVLNENRETANPLWARRWLFWARDLAMFLAPTFLLLGIQATINLIKYKDLFVIGPPNYQVPLVVFSLANVPGGLMGQLWSPEKSVFLYSPPVLLGLVAWYPFFRKDRALAIFSLLLILGNVLLNSAYVFWDTVNWGARYLLLIVPLMVLPIGPLIQATLAWRRRLWVFCGLLAFAAGLAVQGIAALTDDREFLGVTPGGGNLFVAFDLLKHGALDSLVLSLSPSSSLVINPWLWLSLILGGLAMWLLVIRTRPSKGELRPSTWLRLVAPLCILLVGLAAFWIWVLAEYPHILEAKADTKYFAANAYWAEGRSCEAARLYERGLFLETTYAKESRAKLEAIVPRAQGEEIPIGSLNGSVLSPDKAEVTEGAASDDPALRIRAFANKPVDVEVDSNFISLDPNTPFEVSGWLKTGGINRMGHAFIAWYEDNGRWQKSSSTEISHINESAGWRRFSQVVKTLPTTQRMMLRAGLTKTTGTFSVEDVHLVQINTDQPASPLCAPP